MIWKGRIEGSFSNDFEIEVPDGTSREDAGHMALDDWRFVEPTDIYVSSIDPAE